TARDEVDPDIGAVACAEVGESEHPSAADQSDHGGLARGVFIKIMESPGGELDVDCRGSRDTAAGQGGSSSLDAACRQPMSDDLMHCRSPEGRQGEEGTRRDR